MASPSPRYNKKMDQELEMMRARLAQKSAQVKQLEDAPEEALIGYSTPEKYNHQPESKHEDQRMAPMMDSTSRHRRRSRSSK